MKGVFKAAARSTHVISGKVGMASKSQDAETNELVRKFAGLEDYANKLIKDTNTFRDAVASMLTAQAGFAIAFATIFQPILNEASLTSSHPESAETLRNIAGYQDLMTELREAIQPELELIDSRVTAPLKEYQELLKKIRKTVTKREHKLVDFDRFNNSYSKLKDKKEKSLSDEKNLFKLEQDLEIATQEYEHYNGLLKNEIPHFLQLTTAFISPLFQTFYFVKVGILYTILEKIQSWGGQTYGEMGVEGLEEMHAHRIGDTAERYEELTINKRFVGTARLMSQVRQSGPPSSSSSLGRSASSSTYSSSNSKLPPPSRYGAAPAAEYTPPPPPYSGGGAAAPLGAKRAPPPPPAPRPRVNAPAVIYVTALYDYAATAEGDLSFSTGDRIELVKKTDSSEDWWTGRINGQQGVFPGNYVQV